MPPKFSFYINNHLKFQCQLTSERCEAVSKTGLQCKRRTVFGQPYCWTHLRLIKHLRVKPSGIEGGGKGLFAEDTTKPQGSVIFKGEHNGRRGDVIISYGGEFLDENDIIHRYTENYTAPYTVQVQKNLFQDCACERSAGSLANQGFGTGPFRNNAELYARTNTQIHEIFLRAKRDILNGQEIFLAYGRAYRMDEDDVQHFTR